MREDWPLLVSFLPEDWSELAAKTGALKGLRKYKSAENLLRVLLLHLGCGHSLRETAVRARKAALAELSSVAVWKRLRKSQQWLQELCIALFRERGVELAGQAGFQVRAIDATTVKEPGKSGSLWRMHYSVRLPSLACDYFKLTETEGPASGESLRQFPLRQGDYVLAERGYSTAAGSGHVAQAGGWVTVRVNPGALVFQEPDGGGFDLLGKVCRVESPLTARSWPAQVVSPQQLRVSGRVCAIRKTEESIRMAQEGLRKEAARKGRPVQPQTLEFAKYVIVFTTFPAAAFPPADVLEWYRLRWQVELVFKRFKSLAQLGHVPKHDDDSAKAWLYGKLFVALLVEKLLHHARAISPWGYDVPVPAPPQRMA
jgi:hypothetical protein